MAERKISTILDARIDGLKRGLKEASKEAKATADDLKNLEQVSDQLDELSAKVTVDADTKGAVSDLGKVKAAGEAIEKKPYSARVELEHGNALKEVDYLVDELDYLSRLKPTPEVKADIAEAEAKLDKARKHLTELDDMVAEMEVDVDVDAETAGKQGNLGGMAAGKGILAGLKAIPIAAGVAAIGAAAAAGFVAMLTKGAQIDAERDLFGARTGLDEKTAARFGRAAGTAYANAWGESVEANMNTARAGLANGLISSGATEREIEALITQLSGVTTILGSDIPETAEAAGALLKNGLAKDATEAFDILVRGYQRGADRSSDMLDTMREYSSLFASLGLSGPKALGLITQAMEAGARTSDLAADALKEFSIRAQDGSTASADGFKLIGLNAEEMTAKVAASGPAAEQALGQVLDGLRNLEDPVKRNAAGVALFGTQWEDMGNGAAVLAMNLGDLAGAWDDTAGAADAALQRMSDNTASAVESAKRSAEMAMNSVAGAVAAAFEDDLRNLASYLQENRAEIIRFGVAAARGLLDVARVVNDFVAALIRASGHAAGFFATLIDGAGQAAFALGTITGNQEMAALGRNMMDGAKSMREFALDADKIAADTHRAWAINIDNIDRKIGQWAAPEIIAASINDAVVNATRRMDELAKVIDNTKGTVTVNGETVNAERAVELLMGNINTETGTVTVNGKTVPAKQALDRMIAEINAGRGNVTVSAETAPARAKVDEAIGYANRAGGRVHVSASTAEAEQAINWAARNRTSRVFVEYSTAGRYAVLPPAAHGGRVPGRTAGGWVDAPNPGPGIDNVLWPLSYGGKTLSQPLAGGEFVVNSTASREWAPFLEAINAGKHLPAQTATVDQPKREVNVQINYPVAEPSSRGIQAAANHLLEGAI